MNAILSALHIVKRYGHTAALSDASLEARPGEVTALMGVNESGKSTLVRVINGAAAFDEGKLLLDGQEVHFPSPRSALQEGIATVYQELSLVPALSVAENIWLTREPLRTGGIIDRKKLYAETEDLLSLFEDTYQTTFRAATELANLPPGDRQVIEILKGISIDPRLIILDEATTRLDSRQTARLFDLIGLWKREGKAIIFISHRLEEILKIADRYTVLRGGVTTGAGSLSEATVDQLIEMMAGETAVKSPAPRLRTAAPERSVELELQGLHTQSLHGVTFQLHGSELLGLGGLKGQGQPEVIQALFSELPYTGRVILAGEPLPAEHASQGRQKGGPMASGEEVRGQLFSIFENLLVPAWFKDRIPRSSPAAQDSGSAPADLHLDMSGLEERILSLSAAFEGRGSPPPPVESGKGPGTSGSLARPAGSAASKVRGSPPPPVESGKGPRISSGLTRPAGSVANVQKAVIGKCMLLGPRVLLLDNPTRGVDAGSRASFHRVLDNLCQKGMAVLLYSSDEEELLSICDRVLVMRDGMIRTTLAGDVLTRFNLVAASFGPY